MGDLAIVTKEGKFSMSMINEGTKCIVIEEWTKGKKLLNIVYYVYKLKHFRQKSKNYKLWWNRTEYLNSNKICKQNANNEVMGNQFKCQISYIIYCPFSTFNECLDIKEITAGRASRDCVKEPNADQNMVQQWHLHLGAKCMLYLLSSFLCLRLGNS